MRRRSFLKTTGGTVAHALLTTPVQAFPTIPSRPDAKAADAGSWVAYHDGRYLLSLPRVELGQNISTGLKQVASAELGVPWEAVDVTGADTSTIKPYRATVGSESIQDYAVPLAQACAALREAVAAGRTGRVKVVERPYEELRAFLPDAIENDVPIVGLDGIVFGHPLFAADIRLPDMVFGRVLRAPVSPEIASKPASWDVAAAEAESGFVKLVEGATLDLNKSEGLGIVAATPGALDRIEAALSVEWELGDIPADDVIEHKLDIDRRLARGGADYDIADDKIPSETPWDVDLRIDTPTAAHAPIEPRAAVADMSVDRGRIWVGSQDPFYVRDTLADRLHLDEEAVIVIPQRTGGAFGGKVIPMVEIEAAALSLAVKRPVKVQWTRAQELTLAYHRPATSHRVRARVENGRVTDWRHRFSSGHVIFTNAAMPRWMQFFTDFVGDFGSARNAEPPYRFGAKAIGYDLERLPVQTGAWRGLGAGPNGLAIDMAMEACAQAAGQDPIAFRMAHITDPRLKAVLASVVEMADPTTARGRGVGCGIYKGVSYGAVIADVAFGESGTPLVERLFAAHDCGKIVNPDQVRAQCEGNLVWSIGMVLTDRLTFAEGRVAEQDFVDAPIPRIRDVPEMKITLIESDAPPTGAGETLMVAAPAAIANGFSALTGKWPERLPFTARDVRL
ncbi:MAG: molybdopterin cofactor-binding domain-containing protein [Geminicoccales bacterium]